MRRFFSVARGWNFAVTSTVTTAVALLMLASLSEARAAAPNQRNPSAAASAAKEQLSAKLTEIHLTYNQTRGYFIGDLIDPKYRHFANETLAPLMEKHAGLINEVMASLTPVQRTELREIQLRDLAMLCLYERPGAAEQVEKMSRASDVSTAACGSMSKWLADWWKQQEDAQAQNALLQQARDELARKFPREDALANSLLLAASYGAATSEQSAGARSIVETALQSPAAAKYRAQPNKVGKPLTISGTTIAGKNFSTATWKGKVVLVDFWATWCPPCVAALPGLKQIYAEFHPKGLEIVGVSCDSDRDTLKEFLKGQSEMGWPQLFAPAPPPDTRHQLALRFGIQGIPAIYLIDRKGVLRTMEPGPAWKTRMEELLAESP